VEAELRMFLEFAIILFVALWMLREWLTGNEAAVGMALRNRKSSEGIKCQGELGK